MKVIIPFTIHGVGGTSTFATKFSDALRHVNIKVTNRFAFDADCLFIIVDCALWLAFLAKISGIRVVQRLDGVYHPATPYGAWYWLYNIKMKIIHNYLADFVVYQSEFSAQSCRKFLGVPHKQSTLIYNGVAIPSPVASKRRTDTIKPIRLVTFAKFRRQDQIEPIIRAVALLDPREYTLDIYGSYTQSLEQLFTTLPSHISAKGELPNRKLLARLHDYDMFLFADQSACPNAVIEALAAGLPVVGYDRGSISELVSNGRSGEIVRLKHHDPFVTSYPYTEDDYQLMSQAIEKVRKKLETYRREARQSAVEHFDIEPMMNQYLKVISDHA